jgi:2-phosphoglycolate phosphatase
MIRRAVLFDLDGTLVDTAPDMGQALNRLRGERKQPPLPLPTIRPYVSKGAAGLIGVGFPDTTDPTDVEALRQRFLAIYADHLCERSTVFPDMVPVLERIEATAWHRWGIVTNKPQWLARPLLEALGLLSRAACLVCGDTLAKRKPHPDPLWHAAELIDIRPEHSVYVGDDRRDVIAGKAAGMLTVAAGWGYIPPKEPVVDWGAHTISPSPVHFDGWLSTTGWLDAADA